MEKTVRDGKVAVLVSRGFGSGFYTFGAPEQAIFDPALVHLIEERKVLEAVKYVEDTYGGMYTGGVKDLKIHWVPVGKEFIIEEYDGNETLVLKEIYEFLKA